MVRDGCATSAEEMGSDGSSATERGSGSGAGAS